MMLKLTRCDGLTKDNTPRTYTVYLNADHITAVYKEGDIYNTTITLSNGGYLSVMETPDEILLMMQADIRLTPDEWRESRNAH